MKVSAVVVTYNRKVLLTKCIQSLFDQTYPIDEIVIFDNASTDGTQEALQESGILDNKVIKYIRNETNIGGAGGFYRGSKQAYQDGADWIWMMDDDCFPTASALEELLNASQIVDAGFLSSVVHNKNNEACNRPHVDSLNPWFESLEHGLVRISRATFVSFFFNRDTVEHCGLPYEKMFIWGDDDEYSFRIGKYYKPGYFVGKSKVIHDTPGSGSNVWDSESLRRINNAHYLVRNRLLNAREYGTRNGRIRDRIKDISFVFQLLLGKRRKRFRKIGQVFRGYWEYWIGTYDRKAFNQRFTNHLDESNK